MNVSEEQLGSFLWGGAMSEAMAAAIFRRVLRGSLLTAEERRLYTRFVEEEQRHSELLRRAARQYRRAADPSSAQVIRDLAFAAATEVEALAMVVTGERVSTVSFPRVQQMFLSLGDLDTVAAYEVITAEEPAHIQTTRALLRRVVPESERPKLAPFVHKAVGAYRASLWDRTWLLRRGWRKS